MVTDRCVLVNQGVPSAATIDDLPDEVTDDTITLRWSEPQNNGRVITRYTVYQRTVTDDKTGEWIVLKTIADVSVRELKVELETGKVYEFVVTATNELGESLKEDEKIMRVEALAKKGNLVLNVEFYLRLALILPLHVKQGGKIMTVQTSTGMCYLYLYLMRVRLVHCFAYFKPNYLNFMTGFYRTSRYPIGKKKRIVNSTNRQLTTKAELNCGICTEIYRKRVKSVFVIRAALSAEKLRLCLGYWGVCTTRNLPGTCRNHPEPTRTHMNLPKTTRSLPETLTENQNSKN